MSKNIIRRSVKISCKVCPFDSVLLILVSLFLSALPALILCSYNSLIANLKNFELSILLICIYCFLNFLQKSVYDFYNHYYLNYRTLLKFEKSMKINFFKTCSQLDLEDYFSPEIVNETRRAQNASINIFRIYQIIVEIISAIFGIFLISGVTFSIHPSLILFLFLVIVSPIADNIYLIVQRKYLLYKNTQNQKEDEEYVKFLTKPKYLKEIKVFQCFDFIFGKWDSCRQAIVSMEQKSQLKIFVVSLFFHAVKLTGTIGAYWNMTSLYVNQQISLAEFSMAILTFSQIAQLFNQLFSLFGDLSEFAVMVNPYFIFLEKTSKGNKETLISTTSNQDIVIKNISYQYPNTDVWALNNIDLIVKQGSFVSIVGENGSGKTTLSRILLGMLKPTNGHIEISNMTSREAMLHDISYIPQMFNCYCVSMKNNILFGKNIEDNLLDRALDEMGLSELKKLKDDLYGLEFGGMELSGGQKQRIAILRAMFKKADVLIFDEPTSAIDPLQEGLVYHALLNASKGKTTLMISHRLALTKQSDLIIVLKNGTIVERGDHSALLKKGGEYAGMWEAQANLYLE